MSVTAQAIHDALQGVIDPNTQQTFASAKALKTSTA